MRRPQQFRFRKWLLKVHLWVALGLGIYVIVISLSGSAVVFRREFNLWLVPRQVPVVEGELLTGALLESAAQAAYPGYEVTAISEQRREGSPVFINLQRDDEETQRIFDPYAGIDMGASFPWQLQAVEWLVDLHDNLLSGQTGRKINGVGGALFGLLVLTGLVLWWPGKLRWVQSLIVRRSAPQSMIWQLHSAFGIWSAAILAVWAFTAVYFAWPAPFEATIDYFDSDLEDFERPGEAALLWLIQLHFGRFGGLGVRTVWVLLGLVPVAMFVTGFVLWWRSRR